MPGMTGRRPRAGAPRNGASPAATLQTPRYSQSLERGLAILAFFTPGQPEMRLADYRRRPRLSRSTTHRYATTLVALGLSRAGRLAQVSLGLKVIDLGMSALNSTGPARARPPLPRGTAQAELLHREPRRARRGRHPLRRPACAASAVIRARSTWTCTRLAAAGLLHRDGKAAAGEPARERAGRVDRRRGS